MNIQDTLNERGSRYGDFSVHARIAQAIQDEMRCTEGWQRLNYSQRQALTVIADKIARILSGDPNYADNWHDIQGYARLVEERLPVQEVTGDGSGEALPPADGVMDTVLSCMSCGSHPSNHHPKCAEWKEPCLPSLDEVLGAAAPAQVSEALSVAREKAEVIVHLKRLGELDLTALKTLRASCDAELLRKKADRLQGRYHG